MPWYETYAGAAGIIPEFLSVADPRPAKEQLHEGYAHGGGWQKFDGFELSPARVTQGMTINYQGDPPYKAVAWVRLRDELIVVFQGAWVAVIQPGGSYEIARMD